MSRQPTKRFTTKRVTRSSHKTEIAVRDHEAVQLKQEIKQLKDIIAQNEELISGLQTSACREQHDRNEKLAKLESENRALQERLDFLQPNGSGESKDGGEPELPLPPDLPSPPTRMPRSGVEDMNDFVRTVAQRRYNRVTSLANQMIDEEDVSVDAKNIAKAVLIKSKQQVKSVCIDSAVSATRHDILEGRKAQKDIEDLSLLDEAAQDIFCQHMKEFSF